jgi:hypothetical protein
VPQEGEEFRRSLIRYENEMLRAFGFIMNVEHPHRLLCSCCQILFLPYMKEQDKWDFLTGFIQQAWNVANDRSASGRCGRSHCCNSPWRSHSCMCKAAGSVCSWPLGNLNSFNCSNRRDLLC